MFDIPIEEQIRIAREIFPDLEEIGHGICQATCPGVHCHTTANARRDFRIWFEQGKGPHEKCMHGSCEQCRSEAMSALYTLLRRRDPARAASVQRYQEARCAYLDAPTARRAPVPPFDPKTARRIAQRCPIPITEEWLRQHSPRPIPQDRLKWPRLMLDAIFEPGEKILIFTKYRSQGQLMHIAGAQTLRLEEWPPTPGQSYPPRRPSGMPGGGDSGCWFLCAPVTGEWLPNDNNRGKMSRRHGACATRYPYLVLESDECPPADWLRILVQLAEPIVAIYTSGGKSYHALIRVDCETEEQFNLERDNFRYRLTRVGADPAAISAVRLTRLPGCLRFGKGEKHSDPKKNTYAPYLDAEGKPAPRLQELLYLNPDADKRSILTLTATHGN